MYPWNTRLEVLAHSVDGFKVENLLAYTSGFASSSAFIRIPLRV